MAIEAYRVLKRFQWRGWEFAPSGGCECSAQMHAAARVVDGKAVEGNACVENGCTGEVGTGCTACPPEACRCACNIPAETYGGEIWLVEDGHPRKEHMLANRFAVYDDSIPPTDELLKDTQFSRLIQQPVRPAKKRKQVKHQPSQPGDTREPSVV